MLTKTNHRCGMAAALLFFGLMLNCPAQSTAGWPSFDDCAFGNTPASHRMQYSVRHFFASINDTNLYESIAYRYPAESEIVRTNTSGSTQDDSTYWLSHNFGYSCGRYGGGEDDLNEQRWLSFHVAEMVNLYLDRTNLWDIRGPLGTAESVTETHTAITFDVRLVVTNGQGTNIVRTTYKIKGSLEGPMYADGTGAVSEINHGNDHGQACDCEGMPSWFITEPYLNLWVKDRPVFYSTSLGEKISFEIIYRQNDTRPVDTDVPKTGWHHNWFSYIHFLVPVLNSGCATNDNGFSLSGISGPIRVPSQWRFTNDWSQWNAILYAADGGENYFSYMYPRDEQYGLTLLPLDGCNSTNGFRLVHADGSQDIYEVRSSPKYTTGIVRSRGAVFDAGLKPNGVVSFCGNDVTTNANFEYLVSTNESLLGPGSPCGYYACDAVLTSRIDPYGNTTTLQYGGNRLSSITDYDQGTTQLQYNEFGCVTNVIMPYGKSASFYYDSATNMIRVVDAAGMSSSFGYSTVLSNTVLSSISTPYGTTSFSHYQAPITCNYSNPPHITISWQGTNKYVHTNWNGVRQIYVGHYGGTNEISKYCLVTYPGGGNALYMYRPNSSNFVASCASAQEVPSIILNNSPDDGNNGVGGTEHMLWTRNTFHWTRKQFESLSTNGILSFTADDYALGRQSHWLESTWLGNSYNHAPEHNLSDQISMLREASPDGGRPGLKTWFAQSGRLCAWQEGNRSGYISACLMPDGTDRYNTVTYYGGYGLPHLNTETYFDGTTSSRTIGYSYQPGQLSFSNNIYVGYLKFAGLSLSTPGGYSIGYFGDKTNYVTDACGNTTVLEFNDRHQIMKVSRASGLTTLYTYGADGFLSRTVDVEAGRTNDYVFENGLPKTHTDTMGLTRSFSWDKLDRLTKVAFSHDNTFLTNVYDKLNIVASKDRLGNWRHASYDSMNQLQSITDARNNTTLMSYCSCGTLESITDPLSNTTIFERDNLGRVTRTITSGSNPLWSSYAHDPIGRVTNVTDNAGLSLVFKYNNGDLNTNVSCAAGTLLETVYDEYDNPMFVRDAAGNTLLRMFDGLGRVTCQQDQYMEVSDDYEYFTFGPNGLVEHVSPAGKISSFGYDAAGRLESVTRPDSDVVHYEHNALDQLTRLVDANGNSTWWAYDKEGRLIAETNANRVLVKTNGYDANGRLVAAWSAAKGLSRFVYDANGNVVTNQYPGMAARSFSYDSLDRLTSFFNGSNYSTLTYAGFGAFQSALATESTPWMNSTVSRGYTQGRLSSMQAGSTTLGIGYDGIGRPQTFSSSSAGTFTYGYAGAGGRISTLTMPGGTRSFEYEYGLLKSVKLKNAAQSVLDSHTYGYDLDNLITNITRLNNISAAYEYDPLGQLKEFHAFEGNSNPRLNEQISYDYDAAGNLLHRTNNALGISFVPDALNQLSGINRQGLLTVAGSYEGDVNTLSVNGKPTQLYSDKTFATTDGLQLFGGRNTFIPQATNNAGVLVSSARIQVNTPSPAAFQYDLNGNMTGDGRRSFDYDDENQLVRITEAGLWKSEFVYDALGRRRATREYTWQSGAWTKTNEVRYVFVGMLVVQELTANNAVSVTYTRGLDLSGSLQGAGGIGGLLARTDASGTAYYHNDASGNVTAMVNGSGTVVARYLYDPFGNTLGQWGSLAEANTYRFSSKEWHANSGLYYYGFRFYDPGLQRWINQDPLGIAGGINLHGFVGNSPVNASDPLGLHKCRPWDYQNRVPNAITSSTSTYGLTVRDGYPLQPNAFALKLLGVVGEGSAAFALSIAPEPASKAGAVILWADTLDRGQALFSGKTGYQRTLEWFYPELTPEQINSYVLIKDLGLVPLQLKAVFPSKTVSAPETLAPDAAFTQAGAPAQCVSVTTPELTVHAVKRVFERGFSMERIARVIRDGVQKTVEMPLGPQTHYTLGKNTVAVANTGRNAGKITTVFSSETVGGVKGYWVEP